MKHDANDLQEFTAAYIECLIWSSTDIDGATKEGISLDLSVRIAEDCEKFCEENAASIL